MTKDRRSRFRGYSAWKYAEDKHRVAVYLNKESYEALLQLAERMDESVSSVVARAVAEFTSGRGAA